MKITILNIIKTTPTMLQKLFCDIILIADSRPTFFEKVKYYTMIISTLTPVIWFIELFSKLYIGVTKWYILNMQFADFVLLGIIINLIIGCWYHFKMGTFSIEQFIVRNSIIVIVLILGYTMLEMLKITLGKNIFAEGFGTIIQISTLLYPTSKAMKNLYILSNKQFPPGFIMERLYTFEKTGDLKDLFPEEPKSE